MTKKQLFLANARGEVTERTPIWIMRQAGRYLPEYRQVRERMSFSELAKTPEAAAEVTAQPVEILGLDAAIFFSDILFVLEPLGIDLRFDPGPILQPFLTDSDQVAGYKRYDPADHLGFVAKGLEQCRRRLGDDIALLGFCGAPFTVFCYLCGIKGAKDLYKPIRFLHRHPEAAEDVLTLLTDISIDYLQMQLDAGADAVQIFDTWAGELSPEEFDTWAFPALDRIIRTLKSRNQIVSLYIKGSHHLLERLTDLSADIISLDWRTSLPHAGRILPGKCLQGNLSPYTLLGRPEEIQRQARTMLESMASQPGYIFNLGHGILPQTPVENVRALIETVHQYRRSEVPSI